MDSFTMPYPRYGLSAAVETAEADMWEWADRHRLITSPAMREQLARARPYRTTALYYPCADGRRLQAPNRYMALAFLIDDVHDDAILAHDVAAVSESYEELAGVAGGVREPSSAAGRALKAVLEELSEGRSARWREVLGEVNVRWLETYVVEARGARRRNVHAVQPVRVAQAVRRGRAALLASGRVRARHRAAG
ncbi:hypothetical protein [Streptomyces sp. NPDC048357]|uniref:terpene synthase family protein n=1 Tax=Streptomyces sp. NPDC048357 TaxID=3154719 RepID=UPI0034267076